jgi:ribosomal protein S18 acetylase RimI-like enzyme
VDLRIRPLCEEDIEDLVQLGLSAWEPVFASFETVLGLDIFHAIWPEWRKSQREGIEGVCKGEDALTVWVAELGGAAVGFVAYKLNEDSKEGEVEMLAVHPDYQNRGIGTELNCFALEQLREAGMILAAVGTGGDPGHAPARRSYEKAGYTPLPLVRYYKKL